MDLEGFTRRRILEGVTREVVIKGLSELIAEFKEWESTAVHDFSRSVYEEVETALSFEDIEDGFLKDVLGYPKSGVTMGEFGVGSRGEGDFTVHRDISEIIGVGDVVVGPGEQDDAGVVKGEGKYVTVAVDGIHSRLSEFPFLAGFHAARAALRDVYVMGSGPVALISDLHLADDGDVGKLYDYTAGVSVVADKTMVPIVSGSTLRVGGDMVFGDRLVAAVGAVGVSSDRPLARRHAMEGDTILLTKGKGGSTISATAIFSGNFKVIKETLNLDFADSMKAVLERGLQDQIHGMTDVTNGGLRGDAHEISLTSNRRLVLYEEMVKKSISTPVLEMLETLDIDYLGLSTDSLMFILPPENVKKIRSALEGLTSVYECGVVESGTGAALIDEGGVERELSPLFRESCYTKVKKVVGESRPKDFEPMSAAIELAKNEAIKKKQLVLERFGKR